MLCSQREKSQRRSGCSPARPHSPTTVFSPGDIVVSVEGAGNTGGSYTDNQASPLSLYEYLPGVVNQAGPVTSLVLPQTGNAPVSGEYGSSSEGTLQLSGNGQYLTIMGYGINAATFNASPGTYSPVSTNTALAQSGSLTGLSYTPVSRVVALIDASGGQFPPRNSTASSAATTGAAPTRWMAPQSTFPASGERIPTRQPAHL